MLLILCDILCSKSTSANITGEKLLGVSQATARGFPGETAHRFLIVVSEGNQFKVIPLGFALSLKVTGQPGIHAPAPSTPRADVPPQFAL